MSEQKLKVYVCIQCFDGSAYYEFNPESVKDDVFKISGIRSAICKNKSDFDKVYTYQGDPNENNPYNINSLLMTCLIESKISVERFQCVKRCRNALYYIVKATNTHKSELSLLENCFKSDNNKAGKKFEKYINRKRRKTDRNIRKSADEAAKYSFKLDKKNIVYMVLSAVLATAGILVAIFVDGKEIISAFCALIIFPLVKLCYDVAYRYSKFKNNCDSVLLSDVTDAKKAEIIKNIKDYCNRNCKDIEFSDETYDIGGKEIFIYSQKENDGLSKVKDDKTFVINKRKKCVSDEAKKALAAVVEQKRLQEKYLFNGKLLGVESDLNFEKDADIVLKNVDYYSYISCDELIFKKITTANSPEYQYNGCAASIDKDTKMLKRYLKSPLTNLIGINLLVEIEVENATSDSKKSYYIVNRQSTFNDVNGSKFVPSSSGSLNNSDAKRAHNKDGKNEKGKYNFKQTLACGMLRELHEESCLNKKEFKDAIAFLGYSKLMSKGGKPDFFALLKLSFKNEKEVLKIFNTEQNKRLGGKEPLESDFMLLVEKDYFLSDDIKTDNFSPQLKYMRFLLREKSIKNQNSQILVE